MRCAEFDTKHLFNTGFDEGRTSSGHESHWNVSVDFAKEYIFQKKKFLSKGASKMNCKMNFINNNETNDVATDKELNERFETVGNCLW